MSSTDIDNSGGQVFEVRREHLKETRFFNEAIPVAGDGELSLRIDSFALTSNNITYAVTGDMLGYWRFFPPAGGASEGWGRIPVWGFADVIESRVPGIEAGERFYGYYPMASHLRVQPQRVGPLGFSDASAARAGLPAVYNRYQRCASDPLYRPDSEAMLPLFRPLFTTAFFLDDFLADNDFFGASNVVLSSASSKTSISLAWLLRRREGERCAVIGLTSTGNRDFVRSLGCYDEVFSYEELVELPRDPMVFVDMAGNAALRDELHNAFATQLRYSCSVGATHWEASQIDGGAPLPGPTPTLFFAPAQVEKRMEDWGAEGVAQRPAEVWTPFLETASSWLQIRREAGPEAVHESYLALLENRASPSVGYILNL